MSDCKKDGLGKGYQGKIAVTKTGKTCQAWTSDEPHARYAEAKNPANFPDEYLKNAKNYCRNPDSENGGPWCYTTNPSVKWEFCDVQLCDSGNTVLAIIFMYTDIFSSSELS